VSKRLELLERMIGQGSADPFVWYARAMELRSLDRLDDALAAYGEVAGRFPGYVPTYLMAGQTAEKLGRSGDARGWYERGIEAARSAGDGHALSELEAARAALG
jgi:tetratricopeptide (TPR) repeat protein